MAKLNGVQTVDMVNGEIMKIAYDGAEYTKIDGTPNKGDIAEIDREWGNQVKGAFYPVIQEEHRWYSLAPEIVFIDGETCHASNNLSSVNLFRKVEASPVSPPFAEMITAKVEAVEKRVDAIEQSKAKPQYKTEKRHAKVGEQILIVNSESSRGRYRNGDVLKVEKSYGRSGADDVVQAEGVVIGIYDREYEVIIEDRTPATPTYRKVKGRKPRAGDYVKFTETADDALTIGNYYEIDRIDCDDDPVIFDDNGYINYAMNTSLENYEVYGKVGADTPETLTHKGEDYTLVDRKAQTGDVVVFTENSNRYFTNGRAYGPVENSMRVEDNEGDYLPVYRSRNNRTEANTLVYAPVEQPKPTTGDIVVITANTNGSRNKVGDIGKVVDAKLNNGLSVSVDVPGNEGSERHHGNYTKFDEMRLATPAEVEQYERAVAKAEFKAGDYAKVIEKYYEHNVGDILKITEIITTGHDFKVDRIGENDYGYINVKSIEKVSAEEAESITKWAEIGRKPNEYKAGDIVTYDSLTHGCKIANEVIRINNGFIYYYTPGYGVNHVKMTSKRVELIAPVESRVDVK